MAFVHRGAPSGRGDGPTLTQARREGMRMNIHSHALRPRVPPIATAIAPERTPSERQTRILDAAERVFARAGFHAATMQDVAAEAGMSPGNLYRYHLVQEPREKAVICLQIWAEAARNPAMSQMCAAIDGTVAGGLAQAIAGAKAQGELPADLDDARFLQAVFMMADGFLCRRATDPTFDTAMAADTLFAAMRGLARVLLRSDAGDVS
ncbi:MAG: hypothetical protein B7Y93_01850 [Micrococcales bacterium 32-70-13]|nr:MAG: hypothetical protein B7Y93_01850 [Micrococcales bacterium 32-70-13]